MPDIENFYFMSGKDVELVVEDALGPDYTLVSYRFKTYSEEKQGFLGSHWGLVICVKDKSGCDKEHKFFIKTIPYDPQQDQQPVLDEKSEQLFYKETNFYKYIIPELRRHVKEEPTWCARCFKVTDELLLFEDLKDKNFKVRGGVMDTSTLKSALLGLAKLHATSVVAERRRGKSFPELYPRILDESLFTKKTILYKWFLRGVDVTVAMANKCGYKDTSRIQQACEIMFEALGASRKWRNVICHGDAWSNNLLFDDSEPLSTCVMVDYQMTRYAPAMTDVAQLMYLTTRKEYREEHLQELLKHYHEAFCDVLRVNDLEGELQSFEDLLQEYEELKIVGMITVFMYFPIPLACATLSEDFMKEVGGQETLLYKDRTDIVLNMLTRHPWKTEYNARISEIIDEFMEMINRSSGSSRMEVETMSNNVGDYERSSCAIKPKPSEDPVTRKEVEIVVKRALGDNTRIVNYQVKTYSEEKLGFMGAHCHLVATVQKEGSVDKEVLTFFLKAIPHDIEEQAAVIEESNMFFKEANFYQLIMPELIKGLKDKSWMAQCYLVKDDALVFEDLRARNFGIRDKILDTTDLKSALITLAKLHASSILAEKRLGKTFLELYPEVVKESLFSLDGRFSEWFRTGVEVTVAVARSIGMDPSSIPKICHRIFELLSPSKTRRNVLCHGDAWSYNIMFDDTQPQPTCVLVDYQLIRYAPATADVAQLIYLTTRKDYREENERMLLKHYNEVFCKTLKDHGYEIDEASSFYELQQEYEEMRLVGIVTAALYFPINQIEGKLCAEMTKDSEGFSKLMFQERADMVLHLMRKDPFYRVRITEQIKEMCQRSKQLLA